MNNNDVLFVVVCVLTEFVTYMNRLLVYKTLLMLLVTKREVTCILKLRINGQLLVIYIHVTLSFISSFIGPLNGVFR